ncbi:Eco57I restriction-modification methylase domain-containing protein [Paramicrobacterium agarici]|uniref:site-specific DNA-methyltransferase (adenine-specific) n=1 Tax=Paramicrobacterium agarici TaxID=630514 RepID=A0A2A9DUU3_9MICO|nr:restriction endonuclease subunit M [Microbacterium agarici]PFG29925.1 hypothetical protein ATJ78_0844 [Microbacterium agarici]
MISDAIIVGEEWISEHYFTTSSTKQSFQARVIERRKAWDADAKDGIETPKTRFSAVRGELSKEFSTLAEQTDAAAVDVALDGVDAERLREKIYRPLLHALGFDRGGLTATASGPLTVVAPADIEDASAVAVIEGAPAATLEDLFAKDGATLLEPFVPDDDENHPVTSVARLLSRVFLHEAPPTYALVCAGRWMLLAERTRWPEGRYLAIDIQLVVDRNDTKRGGELDTALACIDADSLLPQPDGTVWWDDVLDESVAHTVGVSKDLREGVRRSIEIIGNEVVERRQAQGREPLPQDQAQVLAQQALRYLYRILFLLYAESSPELDVLPVGDAEYDEGYGLSRFRELVQVELTHAGKDRTHFYDSLATLFELVDQGHTARHDDASGDAQGLTFNSLKADLFEPRATALIDEVGLGDGALQRVLGYLLLSREQRGRERGFISYAELGINQLGAVYEGLMSYTGFFAETDLYEVAKAGDDSKGSWVVATDKADDIHPDNFVKTENPITGEEVSVLHKQGSFVYRLAGRERQQSASYYTPEVLTKFVVSQALEELLDQDGHTTTAAEILDLTVCEPALGSGAFAIEATRQLAAEYLTRRQNETGERIDPDAYPQELQRVKASIALHQVHGVDLNATAVELAEISLWLDTMVAGLQAPWFGLRLRRGNSLIGARRAVYSRDEVFTKSWLKDVPRPVPMAELAENLRNERIAGKTAGRIHHFLLPALGWGSAVEAKEAKQLAPEALAALKVWQKSVRTKPTKKQIDRLVGLSFRVERLWQFALRRREIAEKQARRDIDLWRDPRETIQDAAGPRSVTRHEIERELGDPDGACQRLRRVMDAWNALWFWPLTTTLTGEATPPTLDEWLDGLTEILGEHHEASTRERRAAAHGQVTFSLPTEWYALGDAEKEELIYANAKSIAEIKRERPWVAAAERIANDHGFFHWELDFSTVFARRDGFDLQVGNPPWVRPRSDVDALLAEGDPWWQLAVKPTQSQVAEMREKTLAIDGVRETVLDGTTDIAVTAAFVGDPIAYPHLAGLQPDLYRCFMEQTWRNASGQGTIGLIHPETHFTDEKAGVLRAAAYERLRRHWQFINELQLFEIDHHVSYGVHVYSAASAVAFENAANLYHPDTVQSSQKHNGEGPESGIKNTEGKWDLRAHNSRITTVTDETLQTWHALLEGDDVPVRQSRMVYAVNRSTANVLAKLAEAPRLGDLGLEFSSGWHEKNDRTKGYFDVGWGPVESWNDAILQGPHLFVATPFYKSPNESMKHNQDWTAVDLEALEPDALPVTAYKPAKSPAEYDAAYTHWGDDRVPARDHYRIAWRNMAANTGERTLIPAIIPPGAAHVDGLFSLGIPAETVGTLVAASGFMSSLVNDFAIRVAPKSTIRAGAASRLSFVHDCMLRDELALRALRLACVTDVFSSLWEEAFDSRFQKVDWAARPLPDTVGLGEVGSGWDESVPLRRDIDRRQAQLEIDAIVALMLGLTADELCTIYRTQFAVLYGYDRNSYFYDANGRLVPNQVLKEWRKKGDAIADEDRKATHPGSGVEYTYELPFLTLDREADMRQAYAHFERILQERS